MVAEVSCNLTHQHPTSQVVDNLLGYGSQARWSTRRPPSSIFSCLTTIAGQIIFGLVRYNLCLKSDLVLFFDQVMPGLWASEMWGIWVRLLPSTTSVAKTNPLRAERSGYQKFATISSHRNKTVTKKARRHGVGKWISDSIAEPGHAFVFKKKNTSAL
jgi:hypothetical protein